MANSIRTPKQGLTENSRRIAEAVDDEAWQKFRLSMKGKPTETKMFMLRNYFINAKHGHVPTVATSSCEFCLRLDNYIKALCRGGQLRSGETLSSVVRQHWKPRILK